MATQPPADAMSAALAAMLAQLDLTHPDDLQAWESGTGSVMLDSATFRRLVTTGLEAAAQHLCPPAGGQRVEVVAYRDPDLEERDSDQLAVFVNGVPAAIERTVIDPRSVGVTDQDSWDERCGASAATASPLAAKRIRAFGDLGAETNFVTGHPDMRDPRVKVTWIAHTSTQHTAEIPRSVLVAAAKQTDEAFINEDGTLADALFFGLVDGAAFHAVLEAYELTPPEDASTRDWVDVVDPAPDQAPFVITGSDTNAAVPNEENHDGR